MTSSVLEGICSATQSNKYTASNAFLDHMECKRHTMGLQATSVALSMILEVVTSRNTQKRSKRRTGTICTVSALRSISLSWRALVADKN